MPDETCQTCRCWRRTGADGGECRAHAPRPLPKSCFPLVWPDTPADGWCAQWQPLPVRTPKDRPRITCLVGSSRFKARFHEVGEAVEKQGGLVLMMGFFQHADGRPVSEAERSVLAGVDRFRIDLSDDVFVVSGPWPRCPVCKAWCHVARTHVGSYTEWTCGCPPGVKPTEATPVEAASYVGTHTRAEIAYALSLGKPVRWLENEARRNYFAEGGGT